MTSAALPHRQAWLRWAGRLLLAFALLALLVTEIETDALISTFGEARPLAVMAALVLLAPNLWFQNAKWGCILRRACPGVTPADVRASLLLGFTFGLVTPARIGEFSGRAAVVRHADVMTLMGLTVVDKLLTMSMTIAAGAIGLLFYCVAFPFMNVWLLLGIEIMVLLAAALLLRYGLTLRRSWVASSGRIANRLKRVRSAILLLDAESMRIALIFSVLFYLTFITQFLLLLYAFGPVEPLSALAGIVTIMLLKTVVPPVTLGELGIREGASVMVLGQVGIAASVAFSASLLLFAINILLPAVTGLAFLYRARLGWSGVR